MRGSRGSCRVLADGVAAADVVDKPDDLYREAARRCVAAVAGDDRGARGRACVRLLRDVGNDCEQLEQSARGAAAAARSMAAACSRGDAAALARRCSRARCSGSSTTSSRRRAALCEPPLLAALAPLLRHAAGAASDGAARDARAVARARAAAAVGPVALAAWRGIAALLLTKQGEWRKRVAKPEGFGPEHAPLRDRLRALLDDACRSTSRCARRCATVGSLPDARYTEAQWQSLAALQVVLVRLAAELKVAFAERRAVDFVELALAAQRALGQVDAPSELLLALDRRIQHLLVDEFQDTSQSQRRLLELLTAGWQPDDGRTLFLVGDPMQSIYRFRDADMSLFLLAKQRGIGTVRLRSLTLQRNFRSAPAIVSWVNAAFATRVSRGRSTSRRGVPAFRDEHRDARAPRRAVRPHARGGAVPRRRGGERRRDSRRKNGGATPAQSIAVLVQNRRHLEGLRERLRERGLAVHAVEIDSSGRADRSRRISPA